MLVSLWPCLAWLCFVAGSRCYSWPAIASSQGLQTPANLTELPEVTAIRTYFYVGGNYVTDDTGMHRFKDQMYVERLVPAAGAKHRVPLIFIHGAGQTGTVWRQFNPIQACAIFVRRDKQLIRSDLTIRTG